MNLALFPCQTSNKKHPAPAASPCASNKRKDVPQASIFFGVQSNTLITSSEIYVIFYFLVLERRVLEPVLKSRFSRICLPFETTSSGGLAGVVSDSRGAVVLNAYMEIKDLITQGSVVQLHRPQPISSTVPSCPSDT